MGSKLCLTVFCLVIALYMVSGAPSLTASRSSRDLDQIDALRTRLHRLQQQIHDLEAEDDSPTVAAGGRDSKSDVSSELHDVSRGQDGREAQMTSQRQKQVQALAKELNGASKSDLHELAETLNQLLRQTMSERRGLGESNTAGEYLSEKHNNMHSLSGQSVKKYNDDESEEDNQEERGEEEEEEEEETEESEKEQLQTIYNMVAKLYDRQQIGEEGVKSKIGYSGKVPERVTSSRGLSSDFHVHEGTFGDFVDNEEDSQPSASLPSRQEMRKKVLSAIERKLLEDLHEAQEVGITVDDLIQDMQARANKVRSQKLREIESELDKLTEREG